MQETARYAPTASFIINVRRWRTGRKRKRGTIGDGRTATIVQNGERSREAAASALAQIPGA